MSWVTIVTFSAYAVLMSYLVLGSGWPVWKAGQAMIAIGLGVIAIILVIFAFLNREGKVIAKEAFIQSCKKDWQGLCDLLLFRKSRH